MNLCRVGYHRCVGDMVAKNIFWLRGLTEDFIHFAHVSIASLYAVVTLYSFISSGNPYL